jgi:hypothetical protein
MAAVYIMTAWSVPRCGDGLEYLYYHPLPLVVVHQYQ